MHDTQGQHATASGKKVIGDTYLVRKQQRCDWIIVLDGLNGGPRSTEHNVTHFDSVLERRAEGACTGTLVHSRANACIQTRETSCGSIAIRVSPNNS